MKKKPRDAIKEIQSLTDKKLKYAMTKLSKPRINPPQPSKFSVVKERIVTWWRT